MLLKNSFIKPLDLLNILFLGFHLYLLGQCLTLGAFSLFENSSYLISVFAVILISLDWFLNLVFVSEEDSSCLPRISVSLKLAIFILTSASGVYFFK